MKIEKKYLKKTGWTLLRIAIPGSPDNYLYFFLQTFPSWKETVLLSDLVSDADIPAEVSAECFSTSGKSYPWAELLSCKD